MVNIDTPRYKQFIEEWQRADNINTFAEKYGVTVSTARTTSSTIRRAGVDLKFLGVEARRPRRPRPKAEFFASNLQNVMTQRNLSPRDLGETLAVDTNVVRTWTTGRAEPSLGDLISLSRALCLTVDDLLGVSGPIHEDESA
jgi:ribosome-binding protein aMBF1 (putative translation factor)